MLALSKWSSHFQGCYKFRGKKREELGGTTEFFNWATRRKGLALTEMRLLTMMQVLRGLLYIPAELQTRQLGIAVWS